MSVLVYPRSMQAAGQFNGGEILENKPIGFPQDRGIVKPYSNMLYWSHAWTPGVESLIGEHPHQGFEIITFVLSGSIKHYDSKLNEWQLLETGDVQIIRAGSGIAHAELIHAESSVFQIWFDPDLSVSMNEQASYSNYKSESFKWKEDSNINTRYYAGGGSPLEMSSRGVEIFEKTFINGGYSLNLTRGKVRSFYVLEGGMIANNVPVNPHDFVILQDENTLELEVDNMAKIFVIDLLANPGYRTYAQQMGLT